MHRNRCFVVVLGDVFEGFVLHSCIDAFHDVLEEVEHLEKFFYVGPLSLCQKQQLLLKDIPMKIDQWFD